MKKTLFFLCTIAFSAYCRDALQEAIKEINVQAAKEYLLFNPLSKQDKEIYLYLLEQRMKDLNNEIFFNKIVPTINSLYEVVAYIGAFICTTKILALKRDYSYKRDGITPVAIVSVLIGTTYACLRKAEAKGAKYRDWIEQAPVDLLRIKQLILNI
jgi:hypothetical protein